MKLTSELQGQIVKYIKSGNYVETACDAVGIAKKTYYEWLKKGEQGIEPYSNFSNAIKKAKAEAIMRNVLIIQTAAPKNWQAAGWWLERTCYKLFGRKEQLGGIADEPLEIIIKHDNGKDRS
ncbi:MAG: IS630 transposase-related protein [Candidatus Heimdallarchaeaceae archaeon]